MANYYIVKEEIIFDNTFNEGILLKTEDKQRAERVTERTFKNMLKHPNLIGCITRQTENKFEAYNAVSGDSYKIEIEEYNSEDIE